MQARAISIKSVGVSRSYPALFSWAPGDTWLDTVAQCRTNPPPDKIPWSTFRTISPYMEDVLITILIRYVTPTHLINNCYQLTAHT